LGCFSYFGHSGVLVQSLRLRPSQPTINGYGDWVRLSEKDEKPGFSVRAFGFDALKRIFAWSVSKMQETVKKPSPLTEQCSTLGELFQACLELASLRAEHLLAGDRLREQHQRIARELIRDRRL